MKVRLIITDRSWEYRLHVREQEPGRYFATLRTLNGAALEHPVATGSFRSLDVIRSNAHAIYLQLVAMRETNKAAAMSAPATEVSLNHSAEFSNR
jgi:hypothetical protein